MGSDCGDWDARANLWPRRATATNFAGLVRAINFWERRSLLTVRIRYDGRGHGRTGGLVPEAGRGEDVRAAGVRPLRGAVQLRGERAGDASAEVSGVREPWFAYPGGLNNFP